MTHDDLHDGQDQPARYATGVLRVTEDASEWELPSPLPQRRRWRAEEMKQMPKVLRLYLSYPYGIFSASCVQDQESQVIQIITDMSVILH